MSSITTKQGQSSTYSPRTQESYRNRIGNFLSTIASFGSPLGLSKPATELPESPLKARSQPRGGQAGLEEDLGRGITRMRLSEGGAGDERDARGRKARGVVDSALEIAAFEDVEGRMSILDLPDDLILSILEHLPLSAGQLQTVSLVSRRFFDYSQSPSLWAGMYHSTAGYRLSDDALQHGVATVSPPAEAAGWYHLPRDDSAPSSSTLPITPTKPTPPTGTSSSSAALSPSPKSTQIPIHFPTLYRSRHTLSHTIRHPSPTYRTHTQSLSEHSDAVYCITSVGPWLFTGSRDRSIRIWRMGEYDISGQVGETRMVRVIPNVHEGSVLCLAVELDEEGRGTMVTGSSDRTVKIWAINVPTDADGDVDVSLQSTLSDHTNGALDLILTRETIVSCSKDASIRIYDRTTLACNHVIMYHVQSVNALALSPDGASFVSVGGDGHWAIWSMATGKKIKRGGDTKGPGLACVAWRVSPLVVQPPFMLIEQGDYIAIGDNARNVVVYNASTGVVLRTCRGHTDLVRTVDIDTDEGLVVSGSYDGSVRIWDLHTGILLRNLPTNEPTLIFDIAVMPNKLLVARQDHTIDIVSLVTGLPYMDLMLEG